MTKPAIDPINSLNIGLMIISCLAAYALPFELFLFSYAVLGPLHYMTQICWLHDRAYFTRDTRGRKWWLALVGTAMVVVIYGIISSLGGKDLAPALEIGLFYLAFIGALVVTDALGARVRVVVAIIAVLLMMVSSGSRSYAVVAFFLITIIHVFLFTGLFILYGVIKSRSASGLLSLVVFAGCTAVLFMVVPNSQAYRISPWAFDNYGPFNALNAELIRLFGFGRATFAQDIYESQGGLMVMRFIAFAYTYHYLNWFSKTSVIGWHRSARPRAMWIAAAWTSAVVLYAYDFRIGMSVLYAMSILHVMLEFPLDHKTFVALGTELRAMTSGTRQMAAAPRQAVGNSR